MKYFLLLIFMLTATVGCKDTQNQNKMQQTAEPPEEVVGKKKGSVSEYQEKGMEYAMAVQATLGKTLQNKIQEGGIQEAVAFCKVEALPITDSLSRELGATISRITDKPRNPVNAADAEEMKFISNFRAELSGGQRPQALVVRHENNTNFYYPILTNNLCLKCHGTPGDDIRPEVLATLQDLYPQDQATGYSVNQLRGLWKVSFDE